MTPKAASPDRRDRPGQSLGQADADEGAQRTVARRRHGIEAGDRPRLRQPDRAGVVEGPLDVLRHAEVRFDPPAERGERDGLRIGDAGVGSVRGGGLLRPELDPLGAPAGQRPHRDRLVPEPPVDDPAVLDREVVRVDHPRHDGLAQPRARVEHRAGAPPAHRVRGEQHPGDLRVDHPLDHHREPHLGVVDPEVGAVGDGAVRPQRGPAAAHRVEERLDPHDVQVGVLLAGETGRGQVLGGGRRPDRHRHVRRPVARITPSSRAHRRR